MNTRTASDFKYPREFRVKYNGEGGHNLKLGEEGTIVGLSTTAIYPYRVKWDSMPNDTFGWMMYEEEIEPA